MAVIFEKVKGIETNISGRSVYKGEREERL